MRYIVEGDAKVLAYKSRLYTVWANMKQRCFNPKSNGYANYGGRGITVCPMWAKRNGYNEFIDWAVTDNIWWHFGMGQRCYDLSAPFASCSLDRVNNDGPYTPINCRWVDYKEQAMNRRTTKDEERSSQKRRKKAETYEEQYPTARPVIVMDMEGNELARYKSVHQTAIALFGDETKSVAIRYAATKSKKGSYRGYKFKILG